MYFFLFNPFVTHISRMNDTYRRRVGLTLANFGHVHSELSLALYSRKATANVTLGIIYLRRAHNVSNVNLPNVA